MFDLSCYENDQIAVSGLCTCVYCIFCNLWAFTPYESCATSLNKNEYDDDQ